MGPWLRLLVFLLAALSTEMARAQQEQPRSYLSTPEPSVSEPAPGYEEGGVQAAELQQQVVDLQDSLRALAAESQGAAQQNAERIARLEQQLADTQQQLAEAEQQQAAIAARGRALEENRRLRAAWFGQAGNAMVRAENVLAYGSSEVGGLVDDARDLLQRASDDAARNGNSVEAASGQAALEGLDGAVRELDQGNLGGARVDFIYAFGRAFAASATADTYSQPLYVQTPYQAPY